LDKKKVNISTLTAGVTFRNLFKTAGVSVVLGFAVVIPFIFLTTIAILVSRTIHADGPATNIFFIGSIIALVLTTIWGIFLWAVYGQAPYLIIDRDEEVLQALGHSRQMTSGSRWTLVGLMVVSAMILLLGILLFLIGLLWAAPTVVIAGAYAYRKLLATEQGAGKASKSSK
jgi:uncharacterized membrane protein